MASFSGWKRTALYLTLLIATLSVLLIIFLFLSIFRLERNELYKKALRNNDALGLSILHDGSCIKSAELDLWIHLAINIFGTSILAASNFFMQRLAAPSRAEVDAAHRLGHWLNIGVPSLRNFRFLSRRKIIHWSLFCLSSVLLQLTFNGAVFESTTYNSATAILGAEDLINGGWYDREPVYLTGMTKYRDMRRNTKLDYTTRALKDVSDSLISNKTRGNWEKITLKDCMKRYKKYQSLTHYRHVVFVMYDYDDLAFNSTKGWKPADIVKNTTNINNPNETNPFWAWDQVARGGLPETPFQEIEVLPFATSTNEPWFSTSLEESRRWFSNAWVFEDTQNVFDPVSGLFITDPRYFKANHRVLQVDHCLSEKFDVPCQVNISNSLLLIVCVMCVLKLVLCVLVLRLKGNENPLITPGDAISSFIARPDEETKGMCTLTMKDLGKNHIKKHKQIGHAMRHGKWLGGPRQWQDDASTRRFGDAVPKSIWRNSFLLIGSFIIIAAVMLLIAALNQSLGDSQFNDTRDNDRIASDRLQNTPLVAKTMIANLPQVALSICYFTYNGLFTRMLSELEWSKYSIEFRSLRVTEPKGEQNSTYRLQLPYRFSVPLIIISTLLHWVCSNCIYISNYQMINAFYPYEPQFVLSLHFSTKAILTGFCISLCVAIAPAILAYVHLPGTMVIAGGNSAVISAACHYPSTHLQSTNTSRSSRQFDRMNDGLMVDQENYELEEVATRKVKWGVLIAGNGDESLVGHLGFGSKHFNIEKPREGKYYSGV